MLNYNFQALTMSKVNESHGLYSL